ncbi:TetR/AcrR family transcriptional regulator [Amycolatopsis tucumanensis]|uniref:HTH tetR-type domain-containing protein n=1 Tax=Amycolatopsis tucumanensis TaxID=401106 RepID=A0ABP7JWG5_9PSEU|nr:TetR family transcriptional regulator [Amycolatopsis tucumanensis]MCF6427671.1 TetR family transcriptional regulator [Amycolatopsis tucumanensis]
MDEWESRVVEAGLEILAEEGLTALSVAGIARRLGASRMTLHRKGLTRERVIELLSIRAGYEYQQAVWPTLVSDGTGLARLERALRATCQVADPWRHLLVGLFAEDGGIFHEPEKVSGLERDRALATRTVFVEPLARLLRDGIVDGSLAGVPDVDRTATVLFNQVGWTYLALRVGQRWTREQAEDSVVTLALAAVAQRPPG